MAKVTWLGEGDDGPKENIWAGKTFKKGEAVEVDDPRLIEKARGNRFFKVDDGSFLNKHPQSQAGTAHMAHTDSKAMSPGGPAVTVGAEAAEKEHARLQEQQKMSLGEKAKPKV